MSSVSAVSSAARGYDSSSTSSASALPQKTLGQDDFLRLLAQQFQSQDPLKPMEDTSFIAQMAQFTSLQQSGAMSKDISQMKAQQELVAANSYLGHRVTVDVGGGEVATGEVTGVEITDGAPRLVIGEYTYPLSAVLLVEPKAVTASPAANPGQ